MAKKTTTRKPSQADILRLGAAVAQAKADSKPKDWKTLVKTAHAGGYTVAGQLSGLPPALRERTTSSLRDEATKTTADAYKPVYTDLDKQESRVKAWDDKRKADDDAYSTWLTTQYQGISTAARAADSLLADRAGEARKAVSTAWDKLRANTMAAATATTTVTDPAQSAALQQTVPAQAAAEANAGSDEGSLLATLRAKETSREGMAQAAASEASAWAGQRNADTSKAFASIRDARTQAQIKQSGDYLNAFTALKDKELNKAKYNSDTSIAAQTLDVKSAADMAAAAMADRKQTEVEKDNAAGRAAARAKLKLDAAAAANKQLKGDYDGDGKAWQPGDFKLYREIKQTEADAKNSGKPKRQDLNNDGVIDDKDIKPTGDKGLSVGQIKNQQQKASVVTTLRRRLENLHGDPKNPNRKKGETKGGRGFREILLKEGWEDDAITVAESLRTTNGLTPAAKAAAKRLGITDQSILKR